MIPILQFDRLAPEDILNRDIQAEEDVSAAVDAVLAAGWKLSRAEAQRLISAGLVKLNHVPELRGDVRVEEGSLLSARGYGRLRVDEVQGETRHGRTGVVLFRYGK